MILASLRKPGAVVCQATTKSGKTVTIRNLRPADAALLLTYANNLIAEDTFVLLSGRKMTKKEEDAYVKEAVKAIRKGRKVHLLAFIDNELAGSFEVRIFDKRKAHVGEIGISLVPKYRGDGLGMIAMTALIDAAAILKIRLLTLTCFAMNKKAIGLYEKVGFIKAGIIPGMYFYKGNFEDELVMYKKIG